MNTIEIKERPDLKTSEILKLMKEKFGVWSYLNDEELDKQFPAPKETTVRHFQNSPEPDKETRGLSVNQTLEKGLTKDQGITLRERLLLELAYFEKHGEHLDVKGVTFCSGSRYSDGYVPGVYWRSGDQKVRVGWDSLDYSYGKCGVRACLQNQDNVINLDNEKDKGKQGFCITCERCGFSRTI